MKTTVLAFVLVTALAAGAQDATPPQSQPAAQPATGQQPAAQQPAAKKPAVQQPAAEQPAAQQQTEEQAAPEQPAAQQTEEPADGVRAADRHNRHAFSREVSPNASRERLERDPVADPLDEHDGTKAWTSKLQHGSSVTTLPAQGLCFPSRKRRSTKERRCAQRSCPSRRPLRLRRV